MYYNLILNTVSNTLRLSPKVIQSKKMTNRERWISQEVPTIKYL